MSLCKQYIIEWSWWEILRFSQSAAHTTQSEQASTTCTRTYNYFDLFRFVLIFRVRYSYNDGARTSDFLRILICSCCLMFVCIGSCSSSNE